MDLDFLKDNWEKIGIIFLLFRSFVIGVRDALDKTPETDDNWFERFASILKKAAAYALLGTRVK